MKILSVITSFILLIGCSGGAATATNPEAQPKAVQGIPVEKPAAATCDCKKDMADCQCGHCKGTGAPCECEKEEKEHKH